MSEKNVTETNERGFRKTREGLVVSDKMDKTVVVAVEDRVKHALYGKVIRRTNKLKAHDEQNAAGVGDRVLIMETRPLSASKRWRIVEILEKAKYLLEGVTLRVRSARLGRGSAKEPRPGTGRQTGDRRDPAGVATACRRQHWCQGDPLHPCSRWLRSPLRGHR